MMHAIQLEDEIVGSCPRCDWPVKTDGKRCWCIRLSCVEGSYFYPSCTFGITEPVDVEWFKFDLGRRMAPAKSGRRVE